MYRQQTKGETGTCNSQNFKALTEEKIRELCSNNLTEARFDIITEIPIETAEACFNGRNSMIIIRAQSKNQGTLYNSLHIHYQEYTPQSITHVR